MATFVVTDLSLPPTGGEYNWNQDQRLPAQDLGVIAFDIATRPDISVALGPDTPRDANTDVTRDGLKFPHYHVVLTGGFVSLTRDRGDGLPVERAVHERLELPKDFNPRPASALSRRGDTPDSEIGRPPSRAGSGSGSVTHPTVSVWIRYNRGRITVGLGPVGSGKPVFDWTDPHPIEGITRFALGSFDAEAILPVVACYEVPADDDIATAEDDGGESLSFPTEFNVQPAYGQHRFHPGMRLPRIGSGAVAFEASTAGTVVVGLSPQQRVEPAMYEIVASRTECAVRREAQAREDAARVSCDALAADAGGDWVPLWVRVDNGHVTLGGGVPPGEVGHDPSTALVSYADPSPVPVEYVSLTSWSQGVGYRRVRVVDVDPSHGPYSTAQAEAARGKGANAGAAGNGGTRHAVSLGGGRSLEVDSRSAREYLEEKVLPTLTLGIEELLRLVDKRTQDEEQGIEVTSTFHPLNWLASFVMRNNPAAVAAALER